MRNQALFISWAVQLHIDGVQRETNEMTVTENDYGFRDFGCGKDYLRCKSQGDEKQPQPPQVCVAIIEQLFERLKKREEREEARGVSVAFGSRAKEMRTRLDCPHMQYPKDFCELLKHSPILKLPADMSAGVVFLLAWE